MILLSLLCMLTTESTTLRMMSGEELTFPAAMTAWEIQRELADRRHLKPEFFVLISPDKTEPLSGDDIVPQGSSLCITIKFPKDELATFLEPEDAVKVRTVARTRS